VPAFALIGAPVLATLVPFFTFFQRQIPKGLPVHVLKMGVSEHSSGSIVISVIGTGPGGLPSVYVNSKETPWNELDDAIRSQLQVRADWIVYVEGGNEVPWHFVAYPIDVARGLHAEVVLLTEPPKIDSSHSPKAKTKKVTSDVKSGIETGGKN
jgi:hypothetical protein